MTNDTINVGSQEPEDAAPVARVEGHGAAVAPADAKPILEVDQLRMYFPVKSPGLIRRTVGQVQAVDGVSFQVAEATSLGVAACVSKNDALDLAEIIENLVASRS